MEEARTLKGHNKNNVNSFFNRVQMKRIWNTFCEDISKNKGVKEMTFEKVLSRWISTSFSLYATCFNCAARLHIFHEKRAECATFL